MASVAHVGEGFWSGSTWGEIPATSSHYWVGSSPRLSIKDGDGGYARIEFGDPYVTYAGAKLAPFTLDETVPLRINAQVRLTGTWDDGAVFVLGVTDPAVGQGPAWGQEFDLPLNEWVDLSIDVPPGDLGWWVTEPAAAGDLIVYGTGGDVGSTDSWDLSWLEVVSGRDIPTRVYPRADGLGMGAPRLMDGRSPYRSERVFGML